MQVMKFEKIMIFFEFSLQLIDIPNVLRVSGLVLSIKTLTMDGISGFCQRDSPGKVSSRTHEPPDARGEAEIRPKSWNFAFGGYRESWIWAEFPLLHGHLEARGGGWRPSLANPSDRTR